MRRVVGLTIVTMLAAAAVCSVAGQTVRRSRRVLSSADADAIPSAHNISNVPWQQQVTDFSCGAGSMAMILQYYSDSQQEFDAVDQWQIMNVARTTDYQGTMTGDMPRVGRFSALSDAPISLYSNGTARNGFPFRPSGMAAFSFMSLTSWWDTMKALIAADWPIVVLMNWDTSSELEGHYRVVIGYDDTIATLYFNDPWGRDQAPVQAWTYSDFAIAWNYTEQNHPGMLPHWATWVVPLDVSLDVAPGPEPGQFAVTAQVWYPLAEPFASLPHDRAWDLPAAFVRLDTADQLLLGAGMREQVHVGALKPGDTVHVTWTVSVNGTASSDRWVAATARGVMHGEADPVYCCGGARTRDPNSRSGAPNGPAPTGADAYNYPAYDYMDVIGGSVNQTIPF